MLHCCPAGVNNLYETTLLLTRAANDSRCMVSFGMENTDAVWKDVTTNPTQQDCDLGQASPVMIHCYTIVSNARQQCLITSRCIMGQAVNKS